MPSFITPYGSDQLLNWGLNTSGMWIALASGYSSASGIFNEIPSGLGYTRMYVPNWNIASGQATPNVSGLTFGPAINSGWAVSNLGVYDSQSGGNLWWADITTPTGNIYIGHFVSIPSGNLIIGFQSSGC